MNSVLSRRKSAARLALANLEPFHGSTLIAAAKEGLSALKESCIVEIITDSNYVKHGITEWIHKWKRNGWQTGAKKPVVNQDLWHELDEQVSRHKIEWQWTKGHASHADNNRCDELAQAAARGQLSSD